VHSLPAASGECACTAYMIVGYAFTVAMADETVMRPFVKLLWTFV